MRRGRSGTSSTSGEMESSQVISAQEIIIVNKESESNDIFILFHSTHFVPCTLSFHYF